MTLRLIKWLYGNRGEKKTVPVAKSLTLLNTQSRVIYFGIIVRN